MYVLVNKNYETQQQGAKTYTGAMTMIFDTQTYALVESQITVRQGSQDIVSCDRISNFYIHSIYPPAGLPQ